LGQFHLSALADAIDETDVTLIGKQPFNNCPPQHHCKILLTTGIKIPDGGTVTCCAYDCIMRREGFEIS